MHLVHLIENEETHEWYIGYTTDLHKRLACHNGHKNISTRRQGRWNLIYCEAYIHKMDTLGREKFLKSGAGWRFLKKQLKHYLESRDKILAE